MKNVVIYKTIPNGWKVRENAQTAPLSYVWIWNGKSRFSEEYRAALAPIKAVKK